MSTRGDSLSQFVRAQLADGSDKESPRARRSAPRSRDQQILRRAGALLSCTATDVDRSAAAGATGPTARRRSESQLRVVPGGRGGWRVEGIAGEHALCTTITEAEREAERLLRAAGGGEMCVYDAYLRVRRGEAARSRPTHSPTSADQHVARGAPSILTTAEPVPSTTQSTPRRSPSCGAPRGARSLAKRARQLAVRGRRELVTVPELLDKGPREAERAGVEEIFVYGGADRGTPFSSLLRMGGEPPVIAINPANDLVALPYSSGTTGLPKGVMLTHRNLVANICQLAHERLWDEWKSDRVIAVLPFFHIYGLVVVMNLPLYCGGTVVTMPRFELAEFLRAIQDYRITRAFVVPPIVLALAKHPLVDKFDLSSLNLMNSGAAPLSAELEMACGERVGCRMKQGYGLTETSPVTHFVPDRLAGQMPGEVGPLAPNTECRIVDAAIGNAA